MTARKRLAAALGANLGTQAVTAIIQVVSVPVFLHFWSMEQYGGWLILAAIPTYFALADFGFLAVTINKMTIVSASGNFDRANVLFQSAFKLYLFVLAGVCLLAGAMVTILHRAPFDTPGNKFALVLLAGSAVLSMSSALVDAIFRSKGEYALGTHLWTGGRIIEWLGLLAGLSVGHTFLSAAIGQSVACLLTFVLRWEISRKRHPEIRWGISAASGQELRELLGPALAFMAFPAGNAISIQGMTLVVGHLFGPTFLAVFTTYRTISRIQTQAITTIGRSAWPEISRQFGAGNLSAVLSLTRRATLVSVATAIATCIFLSAFGSVLLQLWTSGRIPYQPQVFLALLVPTFLTSTWQMALVALSATNSHLSLSSSYLFASIASLAIAAALGSLLGTYATVAGLICFETMMMIACFVHFRSFTRQHA
jgi:O-antigen/teichoic acid export membrane protein